MTRWGAAPRERPGRRMIILGIVIDNGLALG